MAAVGTGDHDLPLALGHPELLLAIGAFEDLLGRILRRRRRLRLISPGSAGPKEAVLQILSLIHI